MPSRHPNVTTRLHPDTHRRLQSLAAAHDVTPSHLVRRLIEDGLDRVNPNPQPMIGGRP